MIIVSCYPLAGPFGCWGGDAGGGELSLGPLSVGQPPLGGGETMEPLYRCFYFHPTIIYLSARARLNSLKFLRVGLNELC